MRARRKQGASKGETTRPRFSNFLQCWIQVNPGPEDDKAAGVGGHLETAGVVNSEEPIMVADFEFAGMLTLAIAGGASSR